MTLGEIVKYLSAIQDLFDGSYTIKIERDGINSIPPSKGDSIKVLDNQGIIVAKITPGEDHVGLRLDKAMGRGKNSEDIQQVLASHDRFARLTEEDK